MFFKPIDAYVMCFLFLVIVAMAPSASERLESTMNFCGDISATLPNPLHLLHAPTAVLCEKSLGLNSFTAIPHCGQTSFVEKTLSSFSPIIFILPFVSSSARFTLSRIKGSFFLSHLFLSTIISIS